MAANGAELQNEVIEGAAAQTAEQANPSLSDMDAKSPSKENMVCDLGLSAASSVEPNSAEERETVNSRENESAHELAIGVESNVEVEASKENSSSSEKLDTVVEVSNGKMSPLRSSAEEISKACSQTDDPETINVVAVTDLAAAEACAHAIGFENAEITLVVEMNTDADLIPEIGEKGEESKLGGVDTLMEHSKDAVTRVEVLEQMGSFSKNWDTGAEPAAVQQHTQTIVMESMLQQNMENIKPPDHLIDHDVPAASHMHADIETETLVFKNEGVTDGCSLKESADEAKAVERKQEEGDIPAEIQIGEDVGTCTGELVAKPVSILNAASGAAAEGVINDEETKNGETGELVEGSTDMEVEMESGTRPSRKTGVEESIAGDRGHTDELLADVVDGERNTDGMVVKEPAPLAEQSKCAVSETCAESSLCMKGADKCDFVEGCQGSERGSAEEMVVIRKEQGPGSITQQRELGADRGLLENVGVYTGPLQESEGRNGVQEGLGTVEGKLDSTEALGNEEALREEEPGQCSKSHTGMDADTIVFEKLRMNVDLHQHMGSVSGEKSKERRQEMLFETDADITKATGSNQHHQDVDTGSGSGIRHDATRGGARHQLVEAGKEIQGDLLACHIASSANSETSQALDLAKAEQGGQRKEEAHHLVGQEVQASPAVQGLLQNPRSKDVAVEPNYTEGERRVQLERHHNRQVHTEMRVRLQTETLSSDKRAKADLRRNQEVMEGGSGMQTPKDLSLAKHKEVKDEELGQAIGQHWRVGIVMQVKAKADIMSVEGKQQGHMDTRMKEVGYEENQGWAFQGTSYENATRGISRGERAGVLEEEKIGVSDEANTGTSEEEKYSIIGLEKGGMSEKASLKRKFPENVASDSGAVNEHGQNDNVVKKAKKKNVNVWAKTSSRKGPKKNSKNGIPQNPSNEASVLLTPVYVNPDKLEDGPDQPIALSKYDKAEKIELSENRLIASSTKGYRMVRATRGVQEGTWYFEIVVEQLGPTGHTRLGWSTQKGDVQAPVGFDSNSYGYRDLDGSKTHVAVREPYGDLYVEGDVIGFYIHLPDGAEYAPKPAPLLSYRGRPYLSDIKEEHPRKVPVGVSRIPLVSFMLWILQGMCAAFPTGSEICFFRNGVCQGTAFKDINAGRYFPAASMYTLPKEPNCTVRFNFGPEFRFPPSDIGDRPEPKAMFYAPYHNVVNGKEVGSVAWANVSATGNATLNSEPQMKIV